MQFEPIPLSFTIGATLEGTSFTFADSKVLVRYRAEEGDDLTELRISQGVRTVPSQSTGRAFTEIDHSLFELAPLDGTWSNAGYAVLSFRGQRFARAIAGGDGAEQRAIALKEALFEKSSVHLGVLLKRSIASQNEGEQADTFEVTATLIVQLDYLLS